MYSNGRPHGGSSGHSNYSGTNHNSHYSTSYNSSNIPHHNRYPTQPACNVRRAGPQSSAFGIDRSCGESRGSSSRDSGRSTVPPRMGSGTVGVSLSGGTLQNKGAPASREHRIPGKIVPICSGFVGFGGVGTSSPTTAVPSSKALRVLSFRPTDACLKELLSASKANGNAGLKLDVNGSTGSLRFGNGKKFSLSFKKENSVDAQGSLNCLRENNEKFDELGTIESQIRVAATDDAYDDIASRAAKAEKIAKERSTKEYKTKVTASAVDKKIRMARQHQERLGDDVTPSPGTSPGRGSRAGPGETVHGGGTSKKSNEILKRPFRQRVIQLLAVNSYSSVELLARLMQDGVRDNDKSQYDRVLEEVAVPKAGSANKFTLNRAFLSEVQLDWPGYQSYDRTFVKKLLAAPNPGDSPPSGRNTPDESGLEGQTGADEGRSLDSGRKRPGVSNGSRLANRVFPKVPLTASRNDASICDEAVSGTSDNSMDPWTGTTTCRTSHFAHQPSDERGDSHSPSLKPTLGSYAGDKHYSSVSRDRSSSQQHQPTLESSASSPATKTAVNHGGSNPRPCHAVNSHTSPSLPLEPLDVAQETASAVSVVAKFSSQNENSGSRLDSYSSMLVANAAEDKESKSSNWPQPEGGKHGSSKNKLNQQPPAMEDSSSTGTGCVSSLARTERSGGDCLLASSGHDQPDSRNETTARSIVTATVTHKIDTESSIKHSHHISKKKTTATGAFPDASVTSGDVACTKGRKRPAPSNSGGNGAPPNDVSSVVSSGGVVGTGGQGAKRQHANGENYQPPVKEATVVYQFDKDFPVIETSEQRRKYRDIFNYDYAKYKDIYDQMHAIAKKFQMLEERLNATSKNSAEYAEVEQEITREYDAVQADKNVVQGRRQHEYLRAKLAHIKLAVKTYDAAAKPRHESAINHLREASS